MTNAVSGVGFGHPPSRLLVEVDVKYGFCKASQNGAAPPALLLLVAGIWVGDLARAVPSSRRLLLTQQEQHAQIVDASL